MLIMYYDVRNCLSFKNDGEETKHYFEEDEVILIIEDYDNGDFTVEGIIVCITEDTIILRTTNGRLESYYLAYIMSMSKKQ